MRAVLVLAVAAFVLTSCGGGGSHTYVMIPTGLNGIEEGGIYITIVSPVALPESAIAKAQNVRFVERFVKRPLGPEICSYSKPLQAIKGTPYADLNDGKTVTVKVNGSNPFISLVCSELKKGPLDPWRGVTATKNTTPAIGPVAESRAQLKRQAQTLGQPVYWAGPKKGYHYEFRRLRNGQIYVQYLPVNDKAGTSCIQCSYIWTNYLPGVYQAIKKGGNFEKGKNGSVIWSAAGAPYIVTIAWNHVPYEVAVISPNAATAAKIAKSGQVKPVVR